MIFVVVHTIGNEIALKIMPLIILHCIDDQCIVIERTMIIYFVSKRGTQLGWRMNIMVTLCKKLDNQI